MFNNNAILKEKLSEIKKNNFEIPNDISTFDLALSMINHIGTVDPELRDDLIYEILQNWIVNDVFANEQLSYLLNTCVDENHLFYKIGDMETDSVFTRTFSILSVAVMLYMYRKNKFLSEHDLKDIREKVIQYALEEKDLRGYVEDKGWAHSVAHTADALEELVLCTSTTHDNLLEILQVIKTKVCVNNYTYINEEEERMTTAVMSVISRNLITQSELIDWIKEFGNINKLGKYPEDQTIVVNIKNFLRSVYFRMLNEKSSQPIIEAIKVTLYQISNF